LKGLFGVIGIRIPPYQLPRRKVRNGTCIGTDMAKVIACLLQYDQMDIHRGIPLKGRFTGLSCDWGELIEIIQ
jgi:hypothetical protein